MPIEIRTVPNYLIAPRMEKHMLADQTTVEAHRHTNYYELEFVTSGIGIATINELEIHVTPGDIFFMTPLDVHSFHMDNGDIYVSNLSFSEATILPEYQNILFNTQIRYAHFEDTKAITDIFDLISRETQINDHFKSNNINFLVNMILAEFIRVADFENTSAEAHPLILNIVRYVRIHATENITLESVAKSFNISPQHLSRLFKQSLGIGFKQYLISLRLDLAKNLLALTDMSITAVCFDIGFSTLENFIRIFKKNNGITPLEYRKKHKS